MYVGALNPDLMQLRVPAISRYRVSCVFGGLGLFGLGFPGSVQLAFCIPNEASSFFSCVLILVTIC